MKKPPVQANALILESLAISLRDGKSSLQEACQFLNTVARFEERTEVEDENVSAPRQ